MCHFFVTHGVLFSCSIYPLIIKGFDFAQKEPFNLWLKEESMPGFVSWNIQMSFPWEIKDIFEIGNVQKRDKQDHPYDKRKHGKSTRNNCKSKLNTMHHSLFTFVWNQSEDMVDGWLTLIMCERFKTRRAQERCQLYIRASDAQFYSCLGWQCIHIIVDLGNHWVKHILWDHCPKEQDLPPLSTQYDLILFGLMLYANFSLAGIYTYAKSWFVWITNFLSCFCFWLTGFKADDALLWLRCCGWENMVLTQNRIRGQIVTIVALQKNNHTIWSIFQAPVIKQM